MEVDDRIRIEISVGSLASLIAGWYFMYTNTDVHAVPSEVFIELAKRLVPFIEDINIEDWIKESLMIAPMIMFTEDELKEAKEYDIYFEYPNGNVILIVCGEVIT